MSNFANMNYSVGLNTDAAQKALNEFQAGMIRKTEEISGVQSRAMRVLTTETQKQQSESRKTRISWQGVTGAILASGEAATTLTAAMQRILLLTQKVAAVSDRQQSFLGMGGGQQTIQKVNEALSHTVDRMTALTGLRDLKLMGATEKQIENAAKASAVLAKQLGISKQESFGLVTQANLSEQHFQALGGSMAQVNQMIAAAEVKRQRALTESEQQLLKVQYAIELANKASLGFTQSNAQASDKFAQMRVQMDNILLQIGKKLLPYSLKVLQAFNWWLDGVKLTIEETQRWGKILYNLPSEAIKFFGKMFSYVGIQFRKLRALVTMQHEQFAQLQREQDKLFKQQETQQQKILKRRLGLMNALEQASAKLDKKRAERERKATGRPKSRGVSDEARERINEQRSFQLEALNRVRNFSTFALDLASNIGGPVSGVLSALKDYTEQLRIFRAKYGDRFI